MTAWEHRSSSPPCKDLHPARLGRIMATRRMGRPAIFFERVPSTNGAAMSAAEAGCPEGTLIVAEMQTVGRGRKGRVWISFAGTSIVVSLVLETGTAREGLTAIFALATLQALEGFATGVMIKWPNDLYIAGRKIAGILAEGRGRFFVMGMGLNVNENAADLEAIEPGASSLLEATGQRHDRGVVLARILERFEHIYDRWQREGFAPFVSIIEQRLLYMGEAVTIESGTEVVRGRMRGITGEGYLRLSVGESERIFGAGDLSLRGDGA